MLRGIALGLCLFIAGLLCLNPPSRAQLSMTGVGGGFGVAVAACTPGAEATAFLARTSGLNATYTAAVCNLINGMVTDALIDGNLTSTGCGTIFDFIHVYAIQDTTTAQLNLCSTSFSATLNGSPNFSAGNGYLGVDASTTIFIDSSYNLLSGSPNFSLNSAHISAWSLTNAASGASGGVIMGGGTTSPLTLVKLYPKYQDGKFYGFMSTDGSDAGITNADSTGQYIVNRSAASGAGATQYYRNGSSIGTSAVASVTVPGALVYTLANNNAGGTLEGGGYRIAMDSAGASLDATKAGNFYTRMRTYMTAVGVP